MAGVLSGNLEPLRAVEVDTPFGPFSAFLTPEDDAVRVSGLGSVLTLSKALPSSLAVRGWEEGEVPLVASAVEAWLGGDPIAHRRVQVSQVGGAFMQRVWLALREVPAGEVVTYGELAALAGNPKAARAAGHSCARNLIGLFVPCHRVVSSTGVGSYGMGGEEVKRRLLEFEGVDVKRLGNA